MKDVLVLLVLVSLGLGLASAAERDRQPEPEQVRKPAVSHPQPDGQKPAPSKNTATWPRPYKPSEEISADTAVPFPTDI